MSAHHRAVRPKGYMPDWRPKPHHAEIIEQVKVVIEESSFKVSVRFIFYRLVGKYGYPKTELAYKNLAELLVKARRAQMIPFSAIVDSNPKLAGGTWGYSSRQDFLEELMDPDQYNIDAQRGQPYHIELWSEDAGSVPMLHGITQNFPISIYSTGGFSSVTVTHAIAQRVMRRDKPTIFLHIGDFDPSGESIFKSMSQDVGAFIHGTEEYEWDPNTGETYMGLDLAESPDFRPIRVALTREQVEEWGLETAPPKASDSRSANWVGETVQVQAMSEQQMRDVVTSTILNYYNLAAAEKLDEQASEERAEMRPLLKNALGSVIKELGD